MSNCAGAVFLVLIPILATADSRESRVKHEALAMALGSPVSVRLLNHTLLRGRIGEVTDEGFHLQYELAGKVEERAIPFSEVRSIRPYNYMSRGQIIAWVVSIVALVGINIGLAASR